MNYSFASWLIIVHCSSECGPQRGPQTARHLGLSCFKPHTTMEPPVKDSSRWKKQLWSVGSCSTTNLRNQLRDEICVQLVVQSHMCSGHYEASLLKGLDSIMPIHFLLLTPWIICQAEVLITPQIPKAKALRTVTPLQGLIGFGRGRTEGRGCCQKAFLEIRAN